MKKFLMSLALFLILLINSPLSLAQNNDRVNAYYFYTTRRCVSCYRLEQYTEGALKEFFSNELESGNFTYEAVNIDQKENAHFVKDYQLYTKSVVLSLVKDGKEVRFKNLDQIWSLIGNKDRFYEYIKNETRAILDELKTGGES